MGLEQLPTTSITMSFRTHPDIVPRREAGIGRHTHVIGVPTWLQIGNDGINLILPSQNLKLGILHLRDGDMEYEELNYLYERATPQPIPLVADEDVIIGNAHYVHSRSWHASIAYKSRIKRTYTSGVKYSNGGILVPDSETIVDLADLPEHAHNVLAAERLVQLGVLDRD